MISMTKRLPEKLAPNERRQGELIFEVFWESRCGLIRLELFKEFRDLPKTEAEELCYRFQQMARSICIND